MYNHAPKNYICPFCLIVKRVENEHVYTKPQDIIYQDAFITAWIASHGWPNNEGHVIIVSNKHFENIYDLPDSLSSKIHSLEKRIALAIKKAYRCDGVSSRQHNEPDGGQDVWHYHLHVFPRYKDDRLYLNDKKRARATDADKAKYAKLLRKYL